jgi:hypothetical protein
MITLTGGCSSLTEFALGKFILIPKAGITLILINTKKTKRNIMTSIMGMISILDFFLA